MRSPVLALLPLVACATALAACGSSGSGATTAANTVPAGKLGNAGCPAPKVKGFNVAGFSFGGMTCLEAQYYAEGLIRDSKLPGWDCGTPHVSGPYARATCTDGNRSLTVTLFTNST